MAANRSTTSRPRKARTPKKSAETLDTATQQEMDLSSAANNEDLDFGAGIVDDDSETTATPKPRTRKKTATKTKTTTPRKRKAAPAPAEEEAVAAPRHVEPKPEPPRSRDELPLEFEDMEYFGDDDAPADRQDSAASSEGGDSSNGGGEGRGNSDESQEGRPRRRRRRKRNRRGGAPGEQGENRPQGQQQQQRSAGNFQGNNRGPRGRRGGHQDRNQRGPGVRRFSKFEQNAAPAEPVVMSGVLEGILELHPKAYGFLRAAANDYGARDSDPFISSSLVEKYGLREGIKIRGEVGPGTRGQGPRLINIETIDGRPPEEYQAIKHFDTLTPINPFEQIKLETGPYPVTMRVMDLLTPIGKGQRALIVSPPRSGKTMLLQDIANAVSTNHPEIHLIVLLIDERPEEVTEMRRMVQGEVIASSMDRDVESHVRISQLIFERGKRLAEAGKDCFILMDSVTRCARAFNKWQGGGRDSRTMTGGLDIRALEIPRKMFGTARRFDEGGSLTVCATALIDTGSRMDDAIFQEFKGTGNMEMVLSRDLAERRVWPAIDISKSGTRREEKILPREVLDGATMLRRSLVSMNPVEAMEQLVKTLSKFETNKEFLERIRSVL